MNKYKEGIDCKNGARSFFFNNCKRNQGIPDCLARISCYYSRITTYKTSKWKFSTSCYKKKKHKWNYNLIVHW